jgi:hypothetical protein
VAKLTFKDGDRGFPLVRQSSTSDSLGIDSERRPIWQRSAYTREELEAVIAEKSAPVKVLDFLLVGQFEKPINLQELREMGVFGARPPQSIARLSHEKLSALKAHLVLGFDV